MATTNNDMQTLKASYDNITELYNLADEVIQSVLQSQHQNQEEHFGLVNPLVEEVEASTDVLSEAFIDIAEGKRHTQARSSRIEMAFRKMYAALDDYAHKVQETQRASLKAIAEKVNPIVARVKRHIEKVVAIFVNIVDLSLDRIMQKADLESLKQHEANVANMLHSMATGHGKTI
jgi:phage-related minor tail protein